MKIWLSCVGKTTQTVAFTELLKKHKQTIIYFYPRDNTPGCTIEAHDFSANYELFLKHDIGVYGISKDSDASHCNFIAKHGLSIPLISDPDLVLHKKYNTYGEKPMSAKKVVGVISNALWVTRSTFLVDQPWNIIKERRNISAAGHVQSIIAELWLK